MKTDRTHKMATVANMTELARKVCNTGELNPGIVNTVSYWILGSCQYCHKNPNPSSRAINLTIQVNSEDKTFSVYWGKHAYHGKYKAVGIEPIFEQLLSGAELIASKLKFRQDLADRGIDFRDWYCARHSAEGVD